ncbi:RING-type E3 ubiquitin transferase [Trifolium repens]|nr:RING-type E3 ubiquitin transferase [Trifolium repens]
MLQSMKQPCPNEKHGCRELLSYIHEPCWCPLLGCDFVASSKVLSNHFSHKHADSQIKFSYGDLFVVSLKSADKIIVLHEENDGKLFILNNSTTLLGNTVNICCIGPNSSEFEDSYYIFTRSQISKLKFESLAKNIQHITLATLSSEFLVIPVGSSEPLKLEICIPPHKIQIFIKGLDNWWHDLEVKSSDTIGNVKHKIIDKLRIKIPVHQLYLLFQSKALDDRLTIANYNIQEHSNLHLLCRVIGD